MIAKNAKTSPCSSAYWERKPAKKLLHSSPEPRNLYPHGKCMMPKQIALIADRQLQSTSLGSEQTSFRNTRRVFGSSYRQVERHVCIIPDRRDERGSREARTPVSREADSTCSGHVLSSLNDIPVCLRGDIRHVGKRRSRKLRDEFG